ncbi:hypothetical protein Q5424_04945 [Conexibacter sp. JD483]|uniref:hypothetical protein n=1 Tax=unclassified Conexibacter TaxID=2627773 RepID=UPI00271A0763|nr:MULTISPECIES: hypothetical protein [unclassified Conexibacter]MDO8184680.1 hypothetical protein [Conexibacter sp. CPCC 205706]MDO8197986.1 hypothetical protein [Conexibacter sp. CPCC 205762]MDR9368416.1 hypothetical protein [Conexibacter sp. JD483]
MIEAEFHAVWRDSRGRRRDVTPPSVPVGRVVFLPDPQLSFDGRQIDNFRVSLVDDPLVDDFIAAAEAYFEVTNRGKLATEYGRLRVTPEIAAARERWWAAERRMVAKHYDVTLPENMP